MLPDRVALRTGHHLLDQHQKLILNHLKFALQRAKLLVVWAGLGEQVLEDFAAIVPHGREIGRQFGELFSLTQAR